MTRTHEIEAGEISVALETNTARLEGKYGPRFDRSAQVVQVRWGERDFLADDGLPDEYGLWGHGVLGFAPDAPRDAPKEFVKVGIGRLRQNAPGPFKPFQHWPAAELARNVVTARTADRITVEQTLPGKVWSYRQTKTYIVEAEGNLTIEYGLTNLGEESIPVEHYNHNFFAAPIDQRIIIRAEFSVPEPPAGGPWESTPNGIELYRVALVQPHPAWEWTPTSGESENQIELSWSDGFSASVEGDFPMHRVALWAKGEMVCPEVFYRFELQPGKSTRWIRTYRFRQNTDPGIE